MSVATFKIPIAFSAGLIGILLGGGGMWLTMERYGYHWEKEPPKDRSKEEGKDKEKEKGKGKGGANGGGSAKANGGGEGKGKNGGEGKSKGGGPGGPRRANPKPQLVSLVTKLDILTQKPLFVDLTPEQKAKVRDILKGLADDDLLGDESAAEKLDGLLVVLKDHRQSLEAAGFRWPVSSPTPTGPPSGLPNPFQEEDNEKHLKSLENTLNKGAK